MRVCTVTFAKYFNQTKFLFAFEFVCIKYRVETVSAASIFGSSPKEGQEVPWWKINICLWHLRGVSRYRTTCGEHQACGII